MNLTRIIYHLRSLAAELEKIQPPQAAEIPELVDIFAAIREPGAAPVEETPAMIDSAPDRAVIRRKWTNRRHVAYTPEETAFIAKCAETGDSAHTIADKLERRFGFRVSYRAVRHRIAKIEGREAQ